MSTETDPTNAAAGATDLRAAIADSGEALARAAGRLSADAGSEALGAVLPAALAHQRLLCAAGAYADAFATGVMALLTLFRTGRYVPDDDAAAYLEELLTMGVAASVAAQQAPDRFAADHYAAIDAELGPLMLASYRAMGDKATLPPHIAQPLASLADWVEPGATFGGKPIEATMAVDILYDIAARLAALGVLE